MFRGKFEYVWGTAAGMAFLASGSIASGLHEDGFDNVTCIIAPESGR